MKPSKITPICARRRQLEEMFSYRKQELEEVMGSLVGDSDDLSVEQLNDVMGTFQLYKNNLKLDRNEYVMLEGKVSNLAENLDKDYSEAINKIKHYINVESDFGEK